jgi:hypothetical protein
LGEALVMKLNPRFLYVLCLVLLIPDALYSFGWLVMDVMARLGIWPVQIQFVDIYGFVDSMSLWSEIPFILNALLKMLALGMVIARHRYAFWTYLAAYVLHLGDWLMLVGNNYYDASLDGVIQLAAGPVILGVISIMNFEIRGRSRPSGG